MTTASNILRHAQPASRRLHGLRQSQHSLQRRFATRERAYATCHLAGSSTLLPIGD